METKPMCSKGQTLYSFSDWLKSEREDNPITIVKLAQISGVHQNTISNYLSGRCEPTLFNAQCIVNSLGYDLVVVPRDNK